MTYTFNNGGFNTIVSGKDLDEIAVKYFDFMLLFQTSPIKFVYFPFQISEKAHRRIHKMSRRYNEIL